MSSVFFNGGKSSMGERCIGYNLMKTRTYDENSLKIPQNLQLDKYYKLLTFLG